ncbi:MAG: transglycosylase domain-containing protein [Spirochaetes bacterium]|nr:transglycosylase domain-containing protein [Spirochaetota bacterium]
MKKFLIFILFFFIAVCLYYLIEITAAAINTPDLLKKYLSGEIVKIDADDFTGRQIEILLKVQDPGFYHHKGVDFKTPGNGLTTITQAIVKKMYFKNFKPGIAKIRQTLIARFVVHPMVSKKEQLTIFVNTVWFEKNCVGFQSAAQLYFNKDLPDLSEDEYISLVAMLSSPVGFNIRTNSKSNSERVRRIKLLLEGKYKPKGLMDQYYGKLTDDEQKNLAPASYFENLYEKSEP